MEKIAPGRFASDLLAMRSACIEGLGRVSQLLLTGSRRLHDPRRIQSLLEALARHHAVDLVALRRRCSQLLHGRNYLPIPLNSALVLIPLALSACGERTGYINLLSVGAVEPRNKQCRVVMDDGLVLDCFQSEASVRNRLLRGQLVLREMDACGMLPRLDADRWRQKLEIIRAILEEK